MKKRNINSKKEKVTLESLSNNIDNLAMAVGKGFAHVDDRLNKFEDGYNNLENRFDNLEKTMKVGFIEVNEKLTSIDKRLTVVEDTLPPIINMQTVQSHEIRELNMRVDKIEKKLSGK
ncbi:MAG: hypothetical protein WAV11_00010 [Minisyncoccia bacterium]